MQHQGGCHCGAVRYRWKGDPELTFYCHCTDCQKTTGSPYSMELMVSADGFEVDGSAASYVVTGDSGKPVTRWFCSACGSGIYLQSDADEGYVFLKAGTLDDASWVKPQMHIYTAARQPFVKLSDGLPEYEGAP